MTLNKYLVVSPVRNEAAHIEHTLTSMIKQTVRPAEWIIVDDGSTDGTFEILKKYAHRCDWIKLVRRPNRGYHEPGRGVMEAFYAGYEARTCMDFAFVVKLDGDLSFPPEYFASLFEKFSAHHKLGMASGVCFVPGEGGLVRERHPEFHVRGPSKVYRRECWEQIGGLVKHMGWDTIDEVKAQYLGWETKSFKELRIIHYRSTGGRTGTFKWAVKTGRGAYYCGYHPLFLFAKGVRRIFLKPYVVNGAGVMWGFLSSWLKGEEKVADREIIQFLRKEQLKRIFLGAGMWK